MVRGYEILKAGRGYMMRSIIIAVNLCVSMLGVCFAQTSAEAMTRIETRIPPENLAQALRQFANLRHIQVLYLTTEVKNLQTSGASGKLTVDETLSRLLSGTGLAYRYVDSDAVSISIARFGMTEKHNVPAHQSKTYKTPKMHNGREKQNEADPTDVTTTPKEQHPKRRAGPTLGEIVVTGTHINEAVPAYPVTTITNTEIAQSGLSTVADFLRTSPLVFSGGINPGVAQAGPSFFDNSPGAGTGISSANLLGLGEGTTLTLVDGHRLSGSGDIASGDLSLIPLIAVQRVDIQSGGSSAIYGSDAVAGVVNLILRKRYDGAETSGTVDWTQEGGGFTQQYSQLFGRTFNRGSVLLAGEFGTSDPLRADQRAISRTVGPDEYLEPRTKHESVLLNSDYSVSSNLSAHALGLYTHRTAFTSNTSDYSPTRVDEFTSNAGLSYLFSGGRVIGVDVTDAGYNQVRYITETPSNANQVEAIQNGLFAVEIHSSGTIMRLPTGNLSAALGASFRRENMDVEGNLGTSLLSSRRIVDTYMEVNMPLIRNSATRVGLNTLNLDAAVRYSRYSDFGSTTDPEVGIVYTPLPRLTAKASFGRAFRAPTLFELYSPVGVVLDPGSFFQGAPQGSDVLYEYGGNRQLGPATADSFTTTIQFAPDLHPSAGELRTSATYYYIHFVNRVGSPFLNPLQGLVTPLVQSYVIRAPTVAQQAAVITEANGLTNYFGLPYNPPNVAALLEDDNQNIGSDLIHGESVNLEYGWESRLGRLSATWQGTWLQFDQAVLAGSAPQLVAGTVFNPPAFKMRASLGWSVDALSAIAFVNRTGAEKLLGSGAAPIDIGAWTTVDGQVGYTIGRASGDAITTNITVSVINIFNTTPPGVPSEAFFQDEDVGFDTSNASAVGRSFAISAVITW